MTVVCCWQCHLLLSAGDQAEVDRQLLRHYALVHGDH